MKNLLFLLLMFTIKLKAQPVQCTFKQPVITIHFGTGNARDLNTAVPSNYTRVTGSCPTDGHYSYANFTSACFEDDWFTLEEDHTSGDAAGNMMLVNASYNSGMFLNTTIKGLKSGTTYEFGVWLMNLCKITEKCPFPLLPNITIRIQTLAGRIVAQFGIGEVARSESPQWKQHRVLFTTPQSEPALILTMFDNMPGGCGNDFAMDDITFRECVIQPPVVTAVPKKPVTEKKQPAIPKPVTKKAIPPAAEKRTGMSRVAKPETGLPTRTTPMIKQKPPVFIEPPAVLIKRENALVRRIDTEAGEIKIDLYDNGTIDGDTVSIYHNNALLVSHAKLSQKPISFRIAVDTVQPHHELIMVAENLGSIPPNTSVMIVTAGGKRYEVFISSSEQKNAKVVFDLKK